MPGPLSATSEHQRLADLRCAHVDGAALRRILHRVRQQVLEDQAHLAAIGDERDVFDLHVEPHALGEQRQLLVLQHLLHERAQPELARVERRAVDVCHALNDSRFSMSRCSLMPFSRKIPVTSR